MSKASKLVWVIEVANYGSKIWYPLRPQTAGIAAIDQQSRALPMAVFKTRAMAYEAAARVRKMCLKTRVRQARVTMEVLPR